MTILEKHTKKLETMPLATKAKQDQQYFMTTQKHSVTKGLRMMIEGAEMYCEAMARDHDYIIGDDYVLGPAMASITNSLIGLLSGNGRFDGGVLDGALREIAATNKLNDVEQ